MQTYPVLENAVIQALLAQFTDELSATRCLPGDPDGVLFAMSAEDANYGCVVDFARMVRVRNDIFKGLGTVYLMVGIFFIRYDADIEDRLRAMLAKMAYLFRNDHTLGGLSDRAALVEVDTPDPYQVNDQSYYFVPFTIEVWTR